MQGYGMYPLCITTIGKNERNMLFGCETEAVMCVETTDVESLSLTLVNSDILDHLNLSDVKLNKIVSDCKNSNVKVGQIYRDKKY